MYNFAFIFYRPELLLTYLHFHPPGYWLFHCHIEFHAEIGMSLVLKVGDKSEMLAAPPDFPTCYDYTPGLGNQYSGGQHTAGHGALQRVVLFLASITVAVIAKMIA